MDRIRLLDFPYTCIHALMNGWVDASYTRMHAVTHRKPWQKWQLQSIVHHLQIREEGVQLVAVWVAVHRRLSVYR